ncbi:hypothetical protein Halar_0472 (plasmid) [halophilic archaeon DL31]|jgi:DNA-binding PadR family transcriptional regulator|nr:hypothetical protein Halar_0472 [halophilic archaeon DL31]
MEYTVSMVKTLGEFLKSKGGVGLLVVLQNRGKTYSEIEPDVLITSSTISTRLDDACDLGVVEIIPARRHGRTLNEYHLTDFGEAVVQDLAMRGVVSNYRDMRTHYQSMKEKTEEFITWFHENPGEYAGFTEAHEETLIKRDEETSDEDNGDDDASREETSSKVIRPNPDEQLSTGDDDDDPEVGSEDNSSSDDSQHRLSDTDMQEKMKKHAVDSDDGNDEER